MGSLLSGRYAPLVTKRVKIEGTEWKPSLQDLQEVVILSRMMVSLQEQMQTNNSIDLTRTAHEIKKKYLKAVDKVRVKY